MKHIPIAAFLILMAFGFGQTSVKVAEVTHDIIISHVAPVPVTVQILPGIDEIHCLARNLYFEVSVEGFDGRVAAGHVVKNRMADKHYPKTACKVVHQGGEKRRNRCQFSWWCDGQSDKITDKSMYNIMMVIATGILDGTIEDPTNGSLMYHADYVSPYWKTSYKREVKIETHIFYKRKG